jgi:hypothetical protein
MAASYLIVWENNTAGHRKVSGYTWPGHVALNIGNYFECDASVKGADEKYVSWWPGGDGAVFGVGDLVKSVFTKSKKGSHSLCFFSDIESEGYLPDHVIELRTTTNQETAMTAEWKTVFMKRSGASYANLRKNCSTIVARVLHAAGFHAQKWAVDSNWVWTPADVRKLAEKVGGVRLRWNDFADRVIQLSAKTVSSMAGGIDSARSGRLCSTGAPCAHQQNERCVV